MSQLPLFQPSVARLIVYYGNDHLLTVSPIMQTGVPNNLNIKVVAMRSDKKFWNWSFNRWELPTIGAGKYKYRMSSSEANLDGVVYAYTLNFKSPVTPADGSPTIIKFFFEEDVTFGGLFATEEVMWVDKARLVDVLELGSPTPVNVQLEPK